MAPPPTLPESSAVPPAAGWFAAEIQAHDPGLRSYLRGQFPSVRDVDDVVQESYLRLWKAAAAQPIRSARAFLFTVARRLALDHVRRRRTSPIEPVAHLGALGVPAEQADVVDDVSGRERLVLLAEAIATLPDRCRDVFVLYKIRGLSRKAAAAALGLSEKTVEAHTARAMRHCEEFLRRRGAGEGFGP